MPRKGRFGYDPDNTTPDGHYRVGKGRPPEHGKFRKGDGRKRGRRPKGTKNLATDLREELESSIAVTVGGIAKKVTRQRAIVMRMADNAAKGQTSAIALTLEFQQRLVDPMLQHEEHRQAREHDLKCLSDIELEVMIYLTGKVEGILDASGEVVGVIPIYAKGKYIREGLRKHIAAGLNAFGINDHELPALSLGPDEPEEDAYPGTPQSS